ncbi:MAG: glycoside hydrolase family 66 protein, partial [Bradyrhizobium sp.]
MSAIKKTRSLVLALALVAGITLFAAQKTSPTIGPGPNAPVNETPHLDVRADKVWVPPGCANELLVTVPKLEDSEDTRLEVRLETPFGVLLHAASQKAAGGANRIPVPPSKEEGGFLARISLVRGKKVSARGEAVLSVVRKPADDLRYGFFASFTKAGGDYDAKADMLARLHVNAVEYYDYFPAHGYYAPREQEYRFEPFGRPASATDIQRKIEAGHRRGILSLAYVAAYAASKSIYQKCPDPMTDERGVPKIFNGQLMPEDQADREGKPKWFWIMNVDRGSRWNQYIMGEFRRTIDNAPGDLVSFDGFEIDTYGDSADAKFYAKGSRRNGQPLSDV